MAGLCPLFTVNGCAESLYGGGFHCLTARLSKELTISVPYHSYDRTNHIKRNDTRRADYHQGDDG